MQPIYKQLNKEDIIEKIKNYRKSELSRKERIALILFIEHFGIDWKSISEEMNRTFFHRTYPPSRIRQYFEANNPLNFHHLTSKEATRIFQMIVPLISQKRTDICQKNQTKLIQGPCINSKIQWRSIEFMRRRFQQLLVSMMVIFNTCFAPNEKQYICTVKIHQFKDNYRVKHCLQVTYYMIFYMGVKQPNSDEMSDQLLMNIWKSCKELFQLVNFMFENEFYYIEQKFDIYSLRFFQSLPQFTDDEYISILEPILLLDTLNRVSFGYSPYRKILIEKINPDDAFKEIPPIKVKQGHSSIVYEKNKQNLITKVQENFYPRLNILQRKIIANSNTALFLISLYTNLQQQWGVPLVQ